MSVYPLRDSLEDKLLPLTSPPFLPPVEGEPTLAELMADIDRLLKAQQADAYKEVLRMTLRHYFFLLTGYLPETIPSPVVGQYRYCRNSFTNAVNAIEAIFACSPVLSPPPSESSSSREAP